MPERLSIVLEYLPAAMISSVPRIDVHPLVTGWAGRSGCYMLEVRAKATAVEQQTRISFRFFRRVGAKRAGRGDCRARA
jgi:hypothetical protein